LARAAVIWGTWIRTCDERWRIELLRAGGASLDSLAAKFGVDRDAIWRHWHDHVSDEAKAGYLCGPAELATHAERAAIEGDSVLDYPPIPDVCISV
jgi:hypothetical protein